jgi:LPS O-antigen subunit length determinant protein (WzzB/FepE family)
MKTESKYRITIIVLLAAILAVQCAIFMRLKNKLDVVVRNPSLQVDAEGTVDIGNTVNVNLDQVVGRSLVESERGMYIGVNSISNTIIPINWGEISIDR